MTVRHIVVDGENWAWGVGRNSVVMRCGKRKLICPCWKLAGCPSPYEWERAQDKRTSNGAITPGEVAKFIKENSK